MNFIDTNVFVYSLLANQALEKHRTAIEVLSLTDLALSSQVVNELATVLGTKGKLREPELRRILDDIYLSYDVFDQTSDDIFRAFSLRERYQLSYWDSLIVATALRAVAKQLFIEDMQHGLVIESCLTIWNPFTNQIH